MHYYLQYILQDLNEPFFLLLLSKKISTNKTQVCHRWQYDAKGRQQGAELTQKGKGHSNIKGHEASYLFEPIRGSEMLEKVGKLLQCTK